MTGLDPVMWCKKMEEQAKTGEEAYHYHQLGEIYKERRSE